jgi:Uma2 family endonuclease
MSATEKQYQQPPRTALEVFEMLPEGTLAEVINNVIYMSPAPSFPHQDVCTQLAAVIRMHTSAENLGKCIASSIDVYFDNTNVFQPDIIFISNGNMGIVKDEKVKGAPDLIVEVLSSGNKKHDTERKRPVYEKHGVKELFIIDPRSKEVITYYLVNNKFIKQESFTGRITSMLLNKSFSF